MKTIEILKIIRDASSLPNHNFPYTKKMCVELAHQLNSVDGKTSQSLQPQPMARIQ